MRPPGPTMLEFTRGVRQKGFLAYAGELWHEYGDVIQLRFGPRPMILAIHPDAVEQVNSTRRHRYDKRQSYEAAREYLVGDGLLASHGELWRRQRRLMAPFFTPKGVAAYAELMIAEGARLGEGWEVLAEQGAPVEVGDQMAYATASITLRSLFNTRAREAIERMQKAVEVMMAFTNLRMTSTAPPLSDPTDENRQYLAARDEVFGKLEAMIAGRRAQDPASWPDDLLSRLMSARDEETGEPMSDRLVRDESMTLFFAGYETTARALTFAWYALATNPNVASRLHEELDDVLGGRLPSLEDLTKLPYTLQIVKEVLRLYSPVPFYMRDVLEEDELAGYEIPVGFTVMLSPYYTHRHPEFWPNPVVFDPDRWTEEGQKGLRSHAYHPFGGGQRVCIGNHFALLESQILLAILAQRFAPRLQADYEPRWETLGALGLAGGLPMTIATR